MKKFYHLLLLSLIAIYSIGCCCTKDTIRITELENEVITYKNNQSEFEEKITELENKNDICESKKNEFEEKILELENQLISCESEIIFDSMFVRLYVLNTSLNQPPLDIYNKVLLGVYNQSDNRIPAFLAEFEGSDTLHYYQEIYAILSIKNNNLEIHSYQTEKPNTASIVGHDISKDRGYTILNFSELTPYTVELYHNEHNNTLGAHKRGHVQSSLKGTDGVYNLYDIKYTIIDSVGIPQDRIEEFKIVATLTQGDEIHFEVIDAEEKIIIEVDRDHYPHTKIED